MDYLSCDCDRCKNGIEFPAHGLGRRISCPHCGAPVTLSRGTPAVETKPGDNKSASGKVLPKPSTAKPVTTVSPTDFEEKARKWRADRVQWLHSEAQANLPSLTQTNLDKTMARKLRDLFQEISDEFEQKACDHEKPAQPAKQTSLPPQPKLKENVKTS